MDKLKEKADKKIKEGWIRTWIMIECLAIDKKSAKSALETHVKRLGTEKNMMIYKTEYQKMQEVKKPLPGKNIPKAYSYVVEIELACERLDRLVYIVMNYAPSALEILEPDHLKLEAGEVQSILNSISDLMHKFASAGMGGVVVSS